ncbi:MAG: flagellar basal body L-ring protein FlgH [Hyphomicrobium sp.]
MNRMCIAVLLFAGLSAGGCAGDIHEIGREPKFAPIGGGIWSEPVDVVLPSDSMRRASTKGSIWQASGSDLFRDPRAASVGDVVTVKISIDDKASLDTKSNRSRKSSRDASVNYSYDVAFPSGAATGTVDGKVGLDGSTQTDGKGNTSRAESIDLRIAAVVSEVLPNGNMIISGSQEVRVNFELRVVSVAGLVRPRDISSDNSISYEKIAEARISYGGRGRIMEVQQPAWGQQIVDMISPM